MEPERMRPASASTSLPFMPYTAKRFVLMANREARAFASIADTTPTRIDMMLALWQSPLTQKDLVMTYGSTAPVVSRMLKALEKLGWVERKRADWDRRYKIVTLTEEGLSRLLLLCEWAKLETHECNVQSMFENHLLWGEHRRDFRRHRVAWDFPDPCMATLFTKVHKKIWETNYYKIWPGHRRGRRPKPDAALPPVA